MIADLFNAVRFWVCFSLSHRKREMGSCEKLAETEAARCKLMNKGN